MSLIATAQLYKKKKNMSNIENKNISKFIEMVKDARVCMMITSEKDSENISGRPMGINKIDEDGTMWFFTKKSSHKVDELNQSKKTSIAIANNDSNNYLMIHGMSSLSEDRAKMKELWNPLMKAWFSDGLDDADMILIKVVPNEVNYWDSSSSKMVVLFNMLKAIVTGEEYTEGEHGTINL